MFGDIIFMFVVGLLTYLSAIYVLPKLEKKFSSYFFPVKETMRNRKPCMDHNCPPGCMPPKKITKNCSQTLHKSDKGGCYKLCPYNCSSSKKACMNNGCCLGCGYKKFHIPCSHKIDPFFEKKTTIDPHSFKDLAEDDEINFQTFLNESEKDRTFACSPSTTGLFTDCGLPAANMPCYQYFNQ